ncbi:MAG: imidazole glycerol phosphate synthase subunit HisH [Candidatus Brocadiia bacterium]
MIAIVDYGMGNLRSVHSALRRLGLAAEIAGQPSRIADAQAIILPGVGAFGEGMDNLRAAGLDALLPRLARQGRPLLGICLGLQLLFGWSEEHGRHQGLGLFAGGVVRFPQDLTVPHMGWNQVEPAGSPSPLLEGIAPGSHFYFAHSYHVEPDDRGTVVATTDYGGPFASVVGGERMFGVQFHPEKSAAVGERLLANFARLAGEAA